MSATTELLVEQIRKLQVELDSARLNGGPVSELERQLGELNKQLTVSQQALTESKILKG